MPNIKNNITYGDHGLPTYGVIYNRNLLLLMLISIKNITLFLLKI